jgi:hypothetical protein
LFERTVAPRERESKRAEAAACDERLQRRFRPKFSAIVTLLKRGNNLDFPFWRIYDRMFSNRPATVDYDGRCFGNSFTLQKIRISRLPKCGV